MATPLQKIETAYPWMEGFDAVIAETEVLRHERRANNWPFENHHVFGVMYDTQSSLRNIMDVNDCDIKTAYAFQKGAEVAGLMIAELLEESNV